MTDRIVPKLDGAKVIRRESAHSILQGEEPLKPRTHGQAQVSGGQFAARREANDDVVTLPDP